MTVGCPDGMFILQSLPNDVPKPEAFVAGSRAMLEEVTKLVLETFHTDETGEVANEWIRFRDEIAPQSDNVIDHIKQHPEHWNIPLRQELFGGVECDHDGHDVPARGRGRRPRSTAEITTSCAPKDTRHRDSQQLDYVKWSRRGKSQSRDDPARKFPNIIVRGPPGETFSVPLSCRSRKDKEKSESDAPKRNLDSSRLPPILESSQHVEEGISNISYIFSEDLRYNIIIYFLCCLCNRKRFGFFLH